MTPPRPPRARMLTVEQVAQVFGVGRMSVYRLIHAGDLPAYRIGRSFRVEPAAVERYLRAVNTWNGGAR